MADAVIVSTARTPIGRAFRGSLNNIKSPTLMGHAISSGLMAIAFASRQISVDGMKVCSWRPIKQQQDAYTNKSN